ncbi:hypothetical protein [Anaerococcus rubeinfantis]|uniref:hypothetical protein n=1 Tax=Anaerococcus rubeinfantis TaxID=1720199 RepID=UPI00073E4BA5|nr:hypothetical protein [Anaerococcus rubeinfantis]
MKKISKFFLSLGAIYYLFLSLALFLASLFSMFVDGKYVFAIFDLLGFSNISLSIIKPILFVMLFLLFILIASIDRKIFKSIKNGEYFLFNIFTGFFFIFLSIIGHVFLRDKIFILAYVFNAILIIGSMLALKEKSKVYYEEENSSENIVSFHDLENQKNIEDENEKVIDDEATINENMEDDKSNDDIEIIEVNNSDESKDTDKSNLDQDSEKEQVKFNEKDTREK